MLYTSRMKLVVGLGNPESRYTDTRHNVGFAVVDAYAKQVSASWKQSDKFKALVAAATIGGEKVLLVKPTTYYNLVGESVRALMDFYKLTPADILIIHDDLALPLGTIRTRFGGSHGGNNGIKSITAHCGEGTGRLRIGIWDEAHAARDAASVVLSKITRSEQKLLEDLRPTLQKIIDGFVDNNFDTTTYR